MYLRERTMPPSNAALNWLREIGLDDREMNDLNPCVPGEFTLDEAYYVNTATPRVVYRGTAEGTLPMVAGRWYLIPQDILARYSTLTRDTAPVARAVRLTR